MGCIDTELEKPYSGLCPSRLAEKEHDQYGVKISPSHSESWDDVDIFCSRLGPSRNDVVTEGIRRCCANRANIYRGILAGGAAADVER